MARLRHLYLRLLFLLLWGFCTCSNAIELTSIDTNGDRIVGYQPRHAQGGKQVLFVTRPYDSPPSDIIHYRAMVRDRASGTTYVASADSEVDRGVIGGGWPFPASISEDGRIIAFDSWASREIPHNVFVHDRHVGTTEVVSVDSDGNRSMMGGGLPNISANGRFVIFVSWADDLVIGTPMNIFQLYAHDLQTKQTTLLSRDSFGTPANADVSLGHSDTDAHWIVYASRADNLILGDTNGFADIFLHDRQTGQTQRINIPAGGGEANDDSYFPYISRGGKFIFYTSSASNLVTNDLNNHRDLFMYEISSSITTRFDHSSIFSDPLIDLVLGHNGPVSSHSEDGRYIVTLGLTGGIQQVFAHDLKTGETVLVSVSDTDVPGNANSGISTVDDGGTLVTISTAGAISADGSTISFSSNATNLVDPPTSGKQHLYTTENPLLRSNIEYDISLSEGIDLNTESGGGFVITNNGSARNAPFRIKLWWSIDETFDDNDLHELSPVINTVSVDEPEHVLLDFKMPMPPPDGRMSPRLNGDTLSPSEWIGQFIYARGCMMDVTGLIELKCKIEQVKVLPPTPDALQATNGLGTDLIELSWPVPPTDNGQLLADSFRFEELSDGVSREIEARIEDMEVVVENGEPHYLLKLRNRTRGKRLDYARRKACLDNGSGESVCSTWAEGESIGNSIGDALASTDLRGKIQINWATFGAADQGYFLTRCEAGNAETCIDIGRNYRSNTHSTETALEQGHLAYFITNTSFVDTEVERDKTYVYTVKVCDVSNGTSCQAIYPFRLSNQGQSNLIDGFEDDDNFATAQEIHRSINQLHSFDTADDQDWFKLIIDRPQAVQMITSGPLSYDTEITLYNAQNQQIDYNDDAATTFAELTTPELAVGEYFIKVNQKVDPDPFFYRPVPNYNFKVKMKSIVITPIIMLLLDDG